jgi:hypothetical protein
MSQSINVKSLLRVALTSAFAAMAFFECGTSFESGNPSDVHDASALDADEAEPVVVVVPSTTDGAVDGDIACDPNGEPKYEPCLLNSKYGVFVSLTGMANGSGTLTSPVNSIDAAITLAIPEGGATAKRVYVCAGTYDETIAITAARDNVQVFGGFSCTNSIWKYTGTLSTIAPTAQGAALTLTGLTSALFADLEIDAQSAPQAPPAVDSTSGASSVAVLVNGATGVEFRRTKIVAGNGQPGAAGVLVPYSFMLSSSALQGNAANGGAGGPARVNPCPRGEGGPSGGKGGSSPDGDGDPGLPALGQGSGGTSGQCIGGNGADAPTAVNGAGAQTLGAFVAGVWQPAGGSNGPKGAPGQGGGGGHAGSAASPGGGGGGGVGGCGGAGGDGGGGGGASVSVASIDAGITFTSSILMSAAAGKGGSGAPGQPGQTFGAGGFPAGGGCAGGNGGAGSPGGPGGGGAGGVSAGILYKGVAAKLDDATTSLFRQGQAGSKGAGAGPGTNDGVDFPPTIQVLVQ